MTKEEIFNAWAPEGVEWSAWAKPVLFAQWPDTVTPPATTPEWPQPNYLWLPQAGGRTAIVIDLPAVESVRTGILFARRGYRPVPLFNTSHGPSPVIEIAPLVLELGRGARLLQAISVAANAPPVFLIDLLMVIIFFSAVMSLLYHFGRASDRMRPFVMGGGGHVRDVRDGNRLVETGAEFHGGGGVKWWFSGGRRKIGLRAEVIASVRGGGVATEDDRRIVPTAAFSLAYLF